MTVMEFPTKNVAEQKLRAQEIADSHFLNKKTADRFVKFLIEWGKIIGADRTFDRSYAGEWATRFKKGIEYSAASGDAMEALVSIDGMDYAVKSLAKVLDDYNGYKESHKEEALKRIERCLPKTVKGHKTAKPRKTHKKCICNAANRMIGKIPEIKGKNFL